MVRPDQIRIDRRASRRGFALPMVMLLVLVSGIILAVMLERQATQSLTVQRQMNTYTFHHVSRGVQEAVEAWIRSNGGNDIAQALEDDGHAFDLEVEHGQVVRISFFEAQGMALADFAGLRGDAFESARAIVEKLKDQQGAKAALFVRRDGPVTVSVNSAPEEVLRAVIGSTLDMQQTESLVSEIKRAREGGALIDKDGLNGLYDNANIDVESRPRIQGLLTAQPVMWQVVAEAGPTGSGSSQTPGTPSIRYGGLAIIAAGGAREDSSALKRSTSFVSWEILADR